MRASGSFNMQGTCPRDGTINDLILKLFQRRKAKIRLNLYL